MVPLMWPFGSTFSPANITIPSRHWRGACGQRRRAVDGTLGCRRQRRRQRQQGNTAVARAHHSLVAPRYPTADCSSSFKVAELPRRANGDREQALAPQEGPYTLRQQIYRSIDMLASCCSAYISWGVCGEYKLGSGLGRLGTRCPIWWQDIQLVHELPGNV